MNFFTIEAEQRVKKDHYLMRLDKLIDWKGIELLLRGISLSETSSNGGRKAYNSLSMFKALLLGQWHSLSDPGLEEALRLRLDFMLFTGFALAEETPDETTLCRFRNKLLDNGRYERIFQEINSQLEKHGIKIKKADAALVDATIVLSAARPRTTIEEDGEVKRSADPDSTWVKKGQKSYFGYRAYAIADGENGFIDHISVRPANESEINQLPRLLKETNGKRLLADKGFASEENRETLRNMGMKDGISHKARRNHPLRYSQRLFNKIIARRRFRIEQAFGTLKRRFQMSRARYMGRLKVEAEICYKVICFNLNKALRMTQVG
jgi:IS5 family transposase